MKKFFGKKQILLGTLIVALGVAVYLNYFLVQTPTQGPGNSNQSQQQDDDKTLGEAINVNTGTDELSAEEYFSGARKSREEAREEALQTAKDLLTDVKATEAQKQTVTAEVIAMTKAIEQESNIEMLIKAKGFAECVVYISGDSCSVVVQSDALTVQDTAKISQIVTAQADIPAQNINIVTVKS